MALLYATETQGLQHVVPIMGGASKAKDKQGSLLHDILILFFFPSINLVSAK